MLGLVDLLIVDNNLVLDQNGLPQLIGGHQVISQDLIHRIQDKGLVLDLLGERSATSIKQIKNRIQLTCEEDQRVIPGSVSVSFDITNQSVGALNIQAQTNEGDLKLAVPVMPETETDTGGEGELEEVAPNVIYADQAQYVKDSIDSVAAVPNPLVYFGIPFYTNRPYGFEDFPQNNQETLALSHVVDGYEIQETFTVIGAVEN